MKKKNLPSDEKLEKSEQKKKEVPPLPDVLLKRKPRRLSSKAKKLAKVLAKDPSLTLNEAGLKAGYAPGSARHHAHRALNSQAMREEFLEEFQKHRSFKKKAFVDKLAKGTEANETKFFAHEGQVVDERTVENWSARGYFMGLSAKLMGLEPSHKSEITGANGAPLIPDSTTSRIELPPGLTKEELFRLIAETVAAQKALTTPIIAEAVIESVTQIDDKSDESTTVVENNNQKEGKE